MVNVSRETDSIIVQEFEKYRISLDKLEKLQKFIYFLTEQNKNHQFVSRNDVPTIWKRHVYDSIQLMFHVKHYNIERLTDIGSGAGFPGVIVSVLNPHLTVNIIERKQKRCTFIHSVINQLDLFNINLYCRNAQEIKEKFNNVVFRAVGNSEYLNKIIDSVVADNGLVFVYQNSSENLIGLSMDLCFDYIIPGENNTRYIVSYYNSK
ncbi:MAG: hypothetical protein APR63_13400 [Desulfuromonas sp. SDB]|nr:MAG: hypothetical protein APR63_13400 [Desulfuromonas sp. SDB]